MSTSDQLGQYTIGLNIANLTWALPQAITTALFSHSATASDPKAFSLKVARLYRVTVLIALLLVSAMAIAAPYLLPRIYGRQFIPSVLVLHLMLPGVFCLLSLKVLNMDLAGRGRPYISLWIMVPALIVNVLAGWRLVPIHGATGAAMATSLSYCLAGIGFMFLYCRVSQLSLGQLWRYQAADFYWISKLRDHFGGSGEGNRSK